MSPALALGYFFWTRHRRGLTLAAGYWLAVMIFCLAVPASYLKLGANEELWLTWLVFIISALLYSGFLVAIGYFVVVFTFGREARLEGCESGFPSRLWTLPLSTGTLTVSTMLWGSVTMILGWATLALLAGRPYGFDMPLAWPGLVLAVILAWLQAILWTPLPLPWVRVFLMIPVSAILVYTPVAVLALEAPPVVVSGVLALLLPAAYWTAIRGVARARRGDNVPWAWPAWLRWPWAAPDARRPFASTLQAQRWFEWRSNGLAFPVVVAAGLVIELPLMPFLAGILDDAEKGMTPIVPLWLLHHVGSLWLVMASLVIGMPFLAAALGVEMGRFGRATYRMPSFLATRPVSEALLVRAKFESALWSTLAGWGVVAVGLLLWFALGGHAAEAAQQFETMRQRHAPGLVWGWLILLVGGAVVLTWLQMAQRMWMGLTGSRGWIDKSTFSPVAFVALLILGDWLVYHSAYGPILKRLLPWLAGAAVVLKSLAAVWSLSTLRRRELIPGGVLWGALVIWLTLAASLFAALYALLPSDCFSVPVVVLGIVLLLPLTRLALAPLALAWNRHR